MRELPWEIAARRAGQLAPAGPSGTRAALRGVVSSLRRAAATAPELVAGITGLHQAARTAASYPVYVVDRARWSEANAELFATVAGHALSLDNRLQARLAAEETGALLSVLSTRVLGQFDPYISTGRLLLVAPNVVQVERQLDLDVMDFRLWVCLHEQTHAVQFAAAPWLSEYLLERIQTVTAGLGDVDSGPSRVKSAVSTITDLVRGKDGAVGLLAALLTEEEQEEMDRLIAIMSLLEGHADVVMDEVGPARIPSVRRIRASFEKRRDGVGLLDTLVRRLTGMTDKIAQYRDGAAFVRGVVGIAGHEGLNAVWASPENLPRPAEIALPERWVKRVHG
ncbi:MAG TPA: coenzyme F420 biosynthesis-associated protein [Actinomycetales bacterium]|nr:coenzyme F420 biosynthesis-associated protein [Actinomycetales bacterium]